MLCEFFPVTGMFPLSAGRNARVLHDFQHNLRTDWTGMPAAPDGEVEISRWLLSYSKEDPPAPLFAQYDEEGRAPRKPADDLAYSVVAAGRMAALITNQNLRVTLFDGESAFGAVDRGRLEDHAYTGRVLVMCWPLAEIDAVHIDRPSRQERVTAAAFGYYTEGAIEKVFPATELAVTKVYAADRKGWIPKGFRWPNKSDEFLRAVINAAADVQADSADPRRRERARSVLAGNRTHHDGIESALFVEPTP